MSKVTNSRLVIGPVRFSYAHVFAPFSFDGISDEKYSVVCLIPKKDTKTITQIKEAVKLAAEIGKVSKFGGKVPAMALEILNDGDDVADDKPEYKGMYYFNAKSKTRPGVVGPDRSPILDQDEFYSGCWGHVSITFFAYNTAGNKGIGVGLNHVMKTKDDEYLGGRNTAENDFADVDVDDFL